MAFANRYIQRNIVYSEFISDVVDYGLGMIVVIPVYAEFELVKTLESLANCECPNNSVEVYLVVNQSENSEEDVVIQNKKTVHDVEQWKINNSDIFFDLHIITPSPFPKKHAGAGLARKTGMDEAIRRFSSIENKDGIIISLDADTLVDPNYFVEIENHFEKYKREVGACIRFKHRIEEIHDKLHETGMKLYEKYLHYYKNALAFTGYPNAIHTVGSAFAVKAEAYVKQGGMNRRQAGEDFYFLHKLSQLGEIGEINSTCVYPSARLSDRVPFGTGPVLQKWMKGDKSLQETYSFKAFLDMKQLFGLLSQLYDFTEDVGEKLSKTLSEPLYQFLQEDGFGDAFIEIKKNSAKFDSFKKRFFQYFNAFKILKFMNFCHPAFYSFQDLQEAEKNLNNELERK